eukprot:366069-Chlamydomonas_euryale.AAC.4
MRHHKYVGTHALQCVHCSLFIVVTLKWVDCQQTQATRTQELLHAQRATFRSCERVRQIGPCPLDYFRHCTCLSCADAVFEQDHLWRSIWTKMCIPATMHMPDEMYAWMQH